MVDIKKFADKILESGVEFITGVPDTLLNDFCLYVESNWKKDKHVIAANEGNAVALAAGYYLATGTIPLVYMQNSGLGNAVNPLVSLTYKDIYNIPLVLLIGWRGDPDVTDHVQHQKQGELTPILLNDMEIPYRILVNDTRDALNNVKWAVSYAKEYSKPIALIVKKSVLERGEKSRFENESDTLLTREEAINCILDYIPKDSIVVASTGRSTRELHELRNIRKEKHENDFLNVGAMGHSSSIATGIALGTNKTVVCLEGDSSAIMHLGSFTTSGNIKPKNLFHIILNNGAHESVGGQKSAGLNANLSGIAECSGYVTIGKAARMKNEIKASIEELRKKDGPLFLEILIRKGIRPDMPPLKFNLVDSKNILMGNLIKK